MQQTKTTLGVTGLFLGFFSLLLCIIFILNFPGSIQEFSLSEFREGFSGVPPMLPFVTIGSVFSVLGYKSHYGKSALFISAISVAALLILFFV